MGRWRYTFRYQSSSNLRLNFIRLRTKPSSRRIFIDSEAKKLINVNRIMNNVTTDLAKEQIPRKGYGICATSWFKKGDFCLRYSGELISRKEGLKRDDLLEETGSEDSFLYFFTFDSRRLCIDATVDDGTWGRLVNHSRIRPNCHMISLRVDKTPVLVLVAKRDIVPGEELLYDYGESRPEKILECDWIKNS